MSGHSKWANIKHRKEGQDALKGAIFTKMAREIIVAAKMGGGDPAANFRLRIAVQKAKDNKMPSSNIERAIKKGAGEAGTGEAYVETTYEGYTSGGAAVLVQALTDNRNRTAAEVRGAFTKFGGSLGEAGSVGWMFTPKGLISAEAPDGKADDIALAAIDAGAEDVKIDGTSLEVYTAPTDTEKVRQALEAQGVTINSSDLQMVPSTTTPLDEKTGERALRLLDALDSLDDVQKVFSNADIPDSVLAAAG